MSSNLLHTQNYTELGAVYQLVLPLSLEGLVPDDDSVRLLSYELEELDYTLLYKAYSSRKIETACKRDINFMWLLDGQKAPDHSTIARFRTIFLENACEDLFTRWFED